MDAIDRLIEAVKASGLKQIYIAREAGISPSKLSKVLKRHQSLEVEEFIAIARAIGVDPGRLFTDRDLVVELEELRQAYAEAQRVHERLAALLPEARVKRDRVLPVQAAANPNAELIAERETTPQRIPRRAWNRGARIIARAIGDSMDGGRDPMRDGELVYLKPTRSPRTANGHVTLVRRNEGLFLKLFEISGHTIRLVSANGSPTITIDARGEDVQIYGIAVDHQK